ncbi:hypothetical protein CsatA_005736 [Cannabis sativa]
MQSNYSWYFLASADKPLEEDETDWKNTMFKPIKITQGSDVFYRFQHVKERYACLWRSEKDYEDGLYAGDTWATDFDTFKVLDWESLVIFPKTIVAFRPLSSSWYLSNKFDRYMRVLKDAKIADQQVGHEMYIVGDGYVCVKNLSTNQYWKCSGSGVVADSNNTSDTYSIFLPIKVADNVVVLRSLGFNKLMSMSSTGNNENDYLSYTFDTDITDNKAKLMVVERVTSKKIYNINFRHEEGRVYNLSVIEKSQAVADNPGDEHKTMSLTLEYNKTRSIALGNSISLISDVKPIVEVNTIPLIVNKEKIELSAEQISGVGQWGTTNTFDTSTKTNYVVDVPPKTRTIVTLVVTQATCEVPFSYAQKDTFYDGTSKIVEMEDGMYTGVNVFNMQIKISNETLP